MLHHFSHTVGIHLRRCFVGTGTDPILQQLHEGLASITYSGDLWRDNPLSLQNSPPLTLLKACSSLAAWGPCLIHCKFSVNICCVEVQKNKHKAFFLSKHWFFWPHGLQICRDRVTTRINSAYFVGSGWGDIWGISSLGIQQDQPPHYMEQYPE